MKNYCLGCESDTLSSLISFLSNFLWLVGYRYDDLKLLQYLSFIDLHRVSFVFQDKPFDDEFGKFLTI